MLTLIDFRQARVLVLIGGALLCQAAHATLPGIAPDQTFPAPPLESPAHFAPTIVTDGRAALVAVDSGPAAYLYRRNRLGRWVYETALNLPNGTANYGVAIQRDVALVQGQDTNGVGLVDVFARSAGHWNFSQTLSQPGSPPWNDFNCIAIGGDSIAVGSPSANNFAGAVLVYDKVGTATYALNATLTVNGSGEGFFVGINPGLEGNTLVAVSPGNPDLYPFRRTGGVWMEGATFRPAAGYQDFHFALDDNTVVASSILGTAIFVREGGTWTQKQTLVNPDAPDQPIGSVVAIHDRHIALVDANSDKILLFERRAGSWTATAELTGTDPNGCSQTLGGDLANNPVISLAVSDSAVFVGCPMAVNPGLPFTGKVNVYQLPR